MKNPEKDDSRKNALLPLAKALNNVSAACRILGFSRDTFYRASKRPDKGDGLKNGLHKSRMQSRLIAEKRREVEKMILSVASDFPLFGKRRIAKIISETGNYISASKVYSVMKKSGNLNADRVECTIEKKTTLESNLDSGDFREIRNQSPTKPLSGRKSNHDEFERSN